MDSVLISKLKVTLLALGLSAAAAPAWAVTNITSCGEINQPGSYRVTQNLSSQAGPQCLLINASNVTIDLQGHTITGNSSLSSRGITVPPNSNLSNIEVRNGTITSFKAGIVLNSARGARVEHMRVSDNRIGIVAGGAAVVSSNIAVRNSTAGIEVILPINLFGGLIIDNLASENGDGIFISGVGFTIRNNVATNNQFAGITVSCPSLVTDNTTVGNGRVNLETGATGCRSSNNVSPAQ